MAVRADDVDLVRDRALVELCQAGDNQAFAALYDRYHARLLRFCTRRVGNPHEAEEIVQEAFVRAFSAMPHFAGERRFYPWLTVIASRLCIDSHRRAARTEPSAQVDPGTVEGGQQQILDKVDLAYLAQALDQLGPRHREVLELRETRGWTYQQIADHYAVTMGTVEALLFRARKALRREFLAIAGDDHRLLAIPFFGAAWRGLAHVRTRLHHLSTHALPVACAGAASVAAIVGGLATDEDRKVVRAVPARQPHAVTSPAVASPDTGRLLSGSAPLAAAPVKPTPAGGQSGAGTLTAGPVTLTSGDAADGRARTANDRSSLHVAGFTVATDLADAPPLGVLE